MEWVPCFLDLTQAFHSGDEINRELYCFRPKEAIPGAHPEQILKIRRTCYGLTDGPFAWAPALNLLDCKKIIAQEHTRGKNQAGEGRFSGKHVKLEPDGSITVNQDVYAQEKVHHTPLTRKRKQQSYSRCTPQEIERLRRFLGALSWLVKETRCDGRQSLAASTSVPGAPGGRLGGGKSDCLRSKEVFALGHQDHAHRS